MIRRMLRKERTEYGKVMRKKYESGAFWDSRHNMTAHSIRPDEISNTLSTVLKDNLLIEIYGVNEPKGDEKLTNITKVYETNPFKYVELFAGIGGFRQALDKLGGECVLASEIDKYASQAYRVLYDGAEELHGDVTKIEAEDVPDHDVLVGGFPCQAFSVAGKRLGFEDTRGTLFFEIARIAKVKRPKVMLMENVKGLISHDKGRTLDVIVQTLRDLGYTVDFEVMNSKYFGVPQNRERIFIVAIRDDLVTSSPWVIGKRTDVAAKGKRRITELEGVKTFNFDWPSQDEIITRLRDILESNVDERFYLSEEKTGKLIAQLEERGLHENVDVEGCKMIGRVEIKGHDQKTRVYSVEGICPAPSGLGIGGNTEPKIAEVRPVLTPDRIEKRQNGRRFKEDGEESFTLTAQDRHGVAISVKSVGNTNPSGNGMNGQVYDIDGGLSPTLTTNKGEGVKITEAPRYRIRKLTPRECFRLQGFRDEDFDKLTANGISNSQLYKMAGNAVTVNVIDAIGKRLLPYLES